MFSSLSYNAPFSASVMLHNMPNTLRFFRERANLKPADVARELKVTTQTIYNWEGGIRNPSKPNVIKLAELYSCSVGELMPGTREAGFYENNNAAFAALKLEGLDFDKSFSIAFAAFIGQLPIEFQAALDDEKLSKLREWLREIAIEQYEKNGKISLLTTFAKKFFELSSRQ